MAASNDSNSANKKEVIPLTIVTGFLGSGKTTLIHYLLQLLVDDNKTVAIIQNEFGDSTNGVENAFMSGSDGSVFTNVVELANGCVCCSVRDNFALAVEQLAAQKKYNYILLECSGMADPGRIISMFWIDEDLESDIYLDGVISVVDGKYLTSYLKHDENEQLNDKRSMQIIHQIAYADKILLNKLDLIKTQTDLQALKQLVQSINPVGDILVTTKSRVQSIKDVLYIRAYDIHVPPANIEMLVAQTKRTQNSNGKKNNTNQIVQTVDALISTLNEELHDDDGHAHTHDHDHDHDHEHEHEHGEALCPHDADVKSIMMECSGKCVDVDKVDNWLSELLWDDQYQVTANGNDENENKEEQDTENAHKNVMEIYRMKAVLPLKNGDNHYLSAVQDLYEIEKGNLRWRNEQDDGKKSQCLCKMVVIGKHLDEKLLRKGFETIFVDDD